jgi:ubiquinone/menaquinone biosynthesis C-methylase UbiE
MKPIDLYLLVRKKEGRLYPDHIVKNLPTFPFDEPQKVEWRARENSTKRLISYLARLPVPLFVLELGCGNGWLTHKLGSINGVRVIGLDLGGIELKQASHLFSSPNIGFLCSDIFRPPFPQNSFDVIVLASVIQYFADLPNLFTILQPLLTKRGEIHLMDSPIYKKRDLPSARERTVTYYTSLGIPEMAGNYFHHSTDELYNYSPEWLYRPDSWRVRLARFFGNIDSPFPWLRIH